MLQVWWISKSNSIFPQRVCISKQHRLKVLFCYDKFQTWWWSDPNGVYGHSTLSDLINALLHILLFVLCHYRLNYKLLWMSCMWPKLCEQMPAKVFTHKPAKYSYTWYLTLTSISVVTSGSCSRKSMTCLYICNNHKHNCSLPLELLEKN